MPIGDRAIAWIDRYVTRVRPHLEVPPDDGKLFLNNSGRPYTLKGMTMACHRLVQASGVTKEGSCHIFRHTCATLMLERGADLRSIQQMLGHEHLATTEIYTRVSIGQLKKVHAKTHPSARLGRAGAGEDGPVKEDSAEELLAALAEEEDEERDADGELGDDEEDG